jgi:predicted DNA-binding transcriptional regulator AlpA
MKFLRFADLKAAGIVNSWPMLRRRVERDGFPPGIMLGPNTRVWSEQEIEDWLATRPSVKKAAPPRPRKAAAAGHRLTENEKARPE